MEIRNYNDYDTVIIKKESQILAISRAWHGDYISIETNPFIDDIITFEISQEDELGCKLYSLFSEFIDKFISHYKELGYTPNTLKIDTDNRKIEILKSTISNDVTIEDKNNAILITITNKEHNFQNNRVILDKDGDLSYGYYYILQELYYNLKLIEPTKDARLTKKID